MSLNEYKKIYDSLLDGRDLLTLYPTFTGIWEDDREEFCSQQGQNDQLIEEYDDIEGLNPNEDL